MLSILLCLLLVIIVLVVCVLVFAVGCFDGVVVFTYSCCGGLLFAVDTIVLFVFICYFFVLLFTCCLLVSVLVWCLLVIWLRPFLLGYGIARDVDCLLIQWLLWLLWFLGICCFCVLVGFVLGVCLFIICFCGFAAYYWLIDLDVVCLLAGLVMISVLIGNVLVV